MHGVNSYEELLRCPYLGIIDWEYLSFHPEAKFAIQERYKTDITFKMRIDATKSRSPLFKQKFEEYFPSLEKTR